jgi:hypothetical protein
VELFGGYEIPGFDVAFDVKPAVYAGRLAEIISFIVSIELDAGLLVLTVVL